MSIRAKSSVLFVTVAVLGLIAVSLGGPLSSVGDRSESSIPREPTVENPAIMILESGGDPLEALRASLETEALDPHESHKAVSHEARMLLLAHVENLLNTEPWRSSDLDKASSEINKIIAIDDHGNVKRKRDEIRAERRAYDMSIETTAARVSGVAFSYNAGGGETTMIEAAPGETVLERFEIVEVGSDRVSAVDRKRGDRRLTWHPNGEITSP